jgi:hypothetical protein
LQAIAVNDQIAVLASDHEPSRDLAAVSVEQPRVRRGTGCDRLTASSRETARARFGVDAGGRYPYKDKYGSARAV